ncbi:phage holin [Bacillus mesophilum]|uniref:Phage holin n=1 Tax=Bacillus mesophilum TaxID=1071718 RepID=A0A7V7RPB7_9BACI|nr:phage holin [Bacillus mesophilum]KAB2335097.1 phage holin [Bacillus mesophilum]
MDKGTLIRTLVLILALINQLLVAADLNPIPGSEDVWGQIISTVFTGAAAVWAWFKNNYVTARGKAQKEVLTRENLTK